MWKVGVGNGCLLRAEVRGAGVGDLRLKKKSCMPYKAIPDRAARIV